MLVCFLWLTEGPLGPGKPMVPGGPLGPVGPGGPLRPSCPEAPWSEEQKLQIYLRKYGHKPCRMVPEKKNQ